MKRKVWCCIFIIWSRRRGKRKGEEGRGREKRHNKIAPSIELNTMTHAGQSHWKEYLWTELLRITSQEKQQVAQRTSRKPMVLPFGKK